MNDGNVKNNYKDTIFRMLFSEKESLLSLYNALNGTGGKANAQHFLNAFRRLGR